MQYFQILQNTCIICIQLAGRSPTCSYSDGKGVRTRVPKYYMYMYIYIYDPIYMHMYIITDIHTSVGNPLLSRPCVSACIVGYMYIRMCTVPQEQQTLSNPDASDDNGEAPAAAGEEFPERLPENEEAMMPMDLDELFAEASQPPNGWSSWASLSYDMYSTLG